MIFFNKKCNAVDPKKLNRKALEQALEKSEGVITIGYTELSRNNLKGFLRVNGTAYRIYAVINDGYYLVTIEYQGRCTNWIELEDPYHDIVRTLMYMEGMNLEYDVLIGKS